MQNILGKITAIQLLFILSACGNKNESKNIDDNQAIENKATFSYGFTDETITDLQKFITSANNCVNPNMALCQSTNLQLQLRPSDSSKESIMIIDNVGRWSMLGKYRNRTASYTINMDGSISEQNINTKISVGMKEILEKLSSAETEQPTNNDFTKYKVKTERLFDTISKNKIFSKDINSLGLAGHGTPIFGFLAENIPDVNLIVINDKNLLPKEFLCNWQEGHLKTRMKTIATNLNSIAIKHHTQYVNLSFGYSFSVIKNKLIQECNQNMSDKVIVKMLEELHVFFDTLSENSNLALFQAANINNEDWNFEREVSDCSRDKSNRFRVSYSFTDKNALLDNNFALSLNDAKPSLIGSNTKEISKCIDLILDSETYSINKPTEFPFIFGIDGLAYETYKNVLLSTSYITPVALTYIRQLSKKQNKNPIDTYNEITESGTKKMVHWGRSERKL